MGYFMIADGRPGKYVEGSTTSDGKAISFVRSSLDYNPDFHFYTTEDGRWAAILPLEGSTTQNYESQCGESIASEDFMTPSTSADIDVEIDSEMLYDLSATVLDCDGEVIPDPIIHVAYVDREETFTFSEGSIDRLIPLCDSDFTIRVENPLDNDVGHDLPWSAETAGVGYLLACSDFEDGYMYLRIRDDFKMCAPVVMESDPLQNLTTIVSTEDNFKMVYEGIGKGQFAEDKVNISLEIPGLGTSGYRVSCSEATQGCGLSSFYVTCLLYTSPSPRDATLSRMPSSA